MSVEHKILWVDDEIDILEPHIIFLEAKGYKVSKVTNGRDAITSLENSNFDVVFLDEQMPGMGGLETLELIKQNHPSLPVVMITKSEEEDIMEGALGGKIDDYLIKPVNPRQILLTCKRVLDRGKIENAHSSQSYLKSFAEIGSKIGQDMLPKDWVELYLQLVRFDRELQSDEGIRQVFEDQHRQANKEFGRYIEKNFPTWISETSSPPTEERPVLSHEVIPQFVTKHIGKKPVFFILIDCMRYDQWLEFEELLFPLFNIEKDFYYSLLPTATPYSRNAIFSGLLPSEISTKYPEIWKTAETDEHSRNKHEERFLNDLLKRKHLDVKAHYDKILRGHDGRSITKSIQNYMSNDLNAIVVNFVDNLAHSRSDSAVLKEIAPDERAYRSLTRTWFEHSWLYETFKELSKLDCHIVVTTDHGVVRSLHPTKVLGDKNTSTSLRFKFGRSLKCDEKHAIFVKDPHSYGLPGSMMNTNYILAKEDYYFVYPTNYNHYVNLYKDSMQHGGVSLEEMILPVLNLSPKL